MSVRRAIVAAMAIVGAAVVLEHAGTSLVAIVPVESPDAIVSLASHEWERLPETARLAKRFPSAAVILTQPPVVTIYNCHDCGNRLAWLEHLGVAPARLRVLPAFQNSTYGEALGVRPMLKSIGAHRVMVVTSPYHTRRALDVFTHVLRDDGIAVGVAAGWPESEAHPARWWRSPYDRWYVTYEWAAMLDYFVRGRLA